MEVLSPSVYHGQKTYVGSQMLGVGGNGQQSFGNRAEQDGVDDPGIL